VPQKYYKPDQNPISLVSPHQKLNEADTLFSPELIQKALPSLNTIFEELKTKLPGIVCSIKDS
jgi:hypothetical protein